MSTSHSAKNAPTDTQEDELLDHLYDMSLQDGYDTDTGERTVTFYITQIASEISKQIAIHSAEKYQEYQASLERVKEQARQDLLDELEAEVQDIATSKPSVAYATSIPTNKVLYSIAAKRTSLKEGGKK